MTDDELLTLCPFGELNPVRVKVQASDYAYEGWLAAIFEKRSGAFRAVVEDDNGRLFIHNASQITIARAKENA